MKKLQLANGSMTRSYVIGNSSGQLPPGQYRAFFKGDFNNFATLPAVYKIGTSGLTTDVQKEIKKEQLDVAVDGWDYSVDEDRTNLFDASGNFTVPSTSYSDSFNSDTSSRYQAISGTAAYDSANTKLNLTAPAGTWNKTKLKSYKFESGRFTQKLILPTTGHEGDIVAHFFNGSSDMSTNYGVGVKRLASNLWLPVEIKDNAVITTGTSPRAPIQDGNAVALEIDADTTRGVSWLSVWKDENSDIMTFDGINDYINCGTGDSLNITSTMTISTWVLSTENNATLRQGIAGKANINGNEIGWFLSKEIDNRFYFKVRLGSVTPRSDTSTHSNIPYTDCKFHHIVGTLSSDGTHYIYVDGVLQTAHSGTGVYVPALPTIPLVIAAAYGDTAVSAYAHALTGIVGETRLYNRVLSDEEISDLYYGKNVSAGMVGHWINTGNTNTDWIDRSGNGNNNSVAGTPTTTSITGSKLTGTTLKQFAQYTLAPDGTGFKNSRVVKDISASDITTNDYSITKDSLDICPTAVPSGSVVYDGNDTILPKSNTVSTATGNIDIYDTKNVSTIKVRDWDSSAGDCKVFDTVTVGNTNESTWTRVYSPSYTFTGNCVIENGLIRHIIGMTPFVSIYYFDGSGWVFDRSVRDSMGGTQPPTIFSVNAVSITNDSVKINAYLSGHAAIPTDYYNVEIVLNRGNNFSKYTILPTSVITTNVRFYDQSYDTDTFVVNDTLHDTRIFISDTSYNITTCSGIGTSISPDNGSIRVIETPVKNAFKFRQYTSTTCMAYLEVFPADAPGYVFYLGSIPCNCANLYIKPSQTSLTYCTLTTDASYIEGAYIDVVDGGNYIVSPRLSFPTAGTYTVYVKATQLSGTGAPRIYLYDYTTASTVFDTYPVIVNGYVSYTFTITDAQLTHVLKFIIRGNGTNTYRFEYTLFVPNSLVQIPAKRALYNLISSDVANDKSVSIKSLETKARSLVGYTSVPVTEQISFADDFNENSIGRYNVAIGNPSVSNGSLLMRSSNNYCTVYTDPNNLYGDGEYTFKFRNTTSLANDSIGICICGSGMVGDSSSYSPADGYGIFAYVTSGDTYSIRIKKISSGSSTILNSGTVTLTTGAEHIVRITKSGSSIQVYANNVLVVNATDSSYSSGFTALKSYSPVSGAISSEFTNFSFTATKYTYKPALRGASLGGYWDGTQWITGLGNIYLSGVDNFGFFENDGNPNNTGNWAGLKFKNHDRNTVYTNTINIGTSPVTDATGIYYDLIRKNITDNTAISPTKATVTALPIGSAYNNTASDITLDVDDVGDDIGLYIKAKSDGAPILPISDETLIRNALVDTTSNNYYYVDFDIDESDIGKTVQIGVFQNDQSSSNYYKLDYILMNPTELIEWNAKKSMVNLNETVSVEKN